MVNPTLAPTRRLTREERKQSALELTRQGLSCRAIAQQLGCSPKTVSRDLQGALSELHAETQSLAAAYRDLAVSRLDGLLVALQSGIRQGNPRVINAARAIIADQSKLMGCLSERMELNVTGGLTPEQQQSLQDRLATIAGLTDAECND